MQKDIMPHREGCDIDSYRGESCTERRGLMEKVQIDEVAKAKEMYKEDSSEVYAIHGTSRASIER